MAKFVSRRGEIGIAKEASRGTPVVPTQWLPWSTVAFADRVEHVVETSALGRIEDSDYSYVTSKYSEGTIEADVRVAYLGLILTNLFGAAPTPSGGGPYTHTYALTQTNQHQSLSLLVQDKTNPDIVKMFANAMISKWTLKVDAGKIVTNSIDFMALAGKDWTTQTSSFTALGLKFLHQHLSFKVATNLAALTASTAINVRKLELTIEKGVVRSDVAGTVNPEDFNNQEFKVSGSVELTYEDATWLNYMLGQTDRAVEIILNAGSTGILTLRMPLVHFKGWEKDMPLNEIARQKVEFVAHYDAANANAMISTATLVNSVTSY